MPADHLGTGHGVFGIGDEAATLADDRELREREGVVRLDFRDALGVFDGFFLASEPVQVDGQGGMGDGMVWIQIESLEPFGHGGFEIARFLEFESFAVNQVFCCHRVGRLYCGLRA